MRLINLMTIFFWICLLRLSHPVKCDTIPSNSKFVPLYDDEKPRVIFTNKSSRNSDPILIAPSSYYDFVCNSEFFIDNSRLVEYVHRERKVTILLPRRFGKSLNLLMLKNFYEIPIDCVGENCIAVPKEETEAYQLFQHGLLSCGRQTVKLESNFAIKSWKLLDENINQFPVLYISFQRMQITRNGFNLVYRFIVGRIQLTYSHHRYLSFSRHGKLFDEIYDSLTKPPEDTLSQQGLILEATQSLALMLNDYFKKPVMLLIDEYDSILNSAYLSVEVDPVQETDRKDLVAFFGTFYESLLKGNIHILQIVLTGIIPWKDSGLLSILSTVRTSTVLQDYPTYLYGISETDLEAMHSRLYNTTENNNVLLHNLKQYYDGYLFGESKMKRYNPISIAYYFKVPYNLGERKLKAYWGESSDLSGYLLELIKYNDFAASFLALLLPDGIIELSEPGETLLTYEAIQTISKKIDYAIKLNPSQWFRISMNKPAEKHVFLYLYATGYLTKSENCNSTYFALQIPNREIRDTLWLAYYQIMKDDNSLTSMDHSKLDQSYDALVPVMKKIITDQNQTDCSDLRKYFQIFLQEVPIFVGRRGSEFPYYLGNEVMTQSLFESVFSRPPLRSISRERQPKFIKSKQHEAGRPNLVFIPTPKLMVIFEFKFNAHNLNDAYEQALKYVPIYFSEEAYKEVDQIKLIPVNVNMKLTVESNATICTRKQYETIKA